jgi:membrane-bound serine protease (ClpP class)
MPEGYAIIVTLFVVGFLLIAAEVFLPGLILGTIGLLCLIASVVLVYLQFGTAAGLVATFVVGGLSLVGFVIWLFLFPRTFIGRRIMLNKRSFDEHRSDHDLSLVGQSGEAVTPLRPSGTARIGGKRVDVTAIGEFLEEGEEVIVVAADGMRVAVRRKDKLEPATESV